MSASKAAYSMPEGFYGRLRSREQECGSLRQMNAIFLRKFDLSFEFFGSRRATMYLSMSAFSCS